MILQSETVEQCIDAGVHARFVNDVMAARDGAHPIAMVRKRLPSLSETRCSGAARAHSRAGTDDQLAAPASVRPVYDRSRSSDKTYREFPMGHVDLVMGGRRRSACGR